MTETTLPENRWQTIRDIWKDNHWLYALGGIFIGLLIYPAFNFVVKDLATLLQSFVPEAVGIGFTVLFIDQLNQRREEQRRIKDLQDQLVREAGSPIHAVAVNAVDTMRKRGWLGRKNLGDTADDTEALLKGADLSNADLHDADLDQVNLSDAILHKANLSNSELVLTNLNYAILDSAIINDSTAIDMNLDGASLFQAKLHNVKLRHVSIKNAFLWIASLVNADLADTDLSGAVLKATDLRGVKMFYEDETQIYRTILNDALVDKYTRYDESTILPDGSKWSEGRDLAEFGVETRETMSEGIKQSADGNIFLVYTFIDGTTRRWQRGIGWLDDRDGNPIEQ